MGSIKMHNGIEACFNKYRPEGCTHYASEETDVLCDMNGFQECAKKFFQSVSTDFDTFSVYSECFGFDSTGTILSVDNDDAWTCLVDTYPEVASALDDCGIQC